MLGYRLSIGLCVGIIFAVQHTVVIRLSGPSRSVMGYVISLGFFAALSEFATLGLGRRLTGRRAVPLEGPERVPVAGALAVASLLLLLDLASKTLSPYFALQRRPPPTIPLMVVVGVWLVLVWRSCRPSASNRIGVLGLAGLILGTRVLVLRVSPFDRLTGDMLSTIDRALDELLAGRFPYVNFPPPMPYLPGSFLAYLPPKLLGCDLRLTNLALDFVSAIVAMTFAPDQGARAGSDASRGRSRADFSPGQLALPLLMLHPTWVYYGVNTQFAPSLLATVILGRALTSAGPRVQAVALGLAVVSNQMLAVTGPILFGYWLSQFGWRRAVGLSAIATTVFLAVLAPFLLWSPTRFLQVAFLDRAGFPVELLSGRFTILPLFHQLFPTALSLPETSLVLSVLVIGIASMIATRTRRPEDAVATMALGLYGSLVVQPVSFAHYFLPVLVLAAIATGGRRSTNPGSRPREGFVPAPLVPQRSGLAFSAPGAEHSRRHRTDSLHRAGRHNGVE